MSAREAVAKGLIGAGRVAFSVLPSGLRRRMEARFFYAVFQVTRVTNDAYGWRPEPEAGDEKTEES